MSPGVLLPLLHSLMTWDKYLRDALEIPAPLSIDQIDKFGDEGVLGTETPAIFRHPTRDHSSVVLRPNKPTPAIVRQLRERPRCTVSFLRDLA